MSGHACAVLALSVRQTSILKSMGNRMRLDGVRSLLDSVGCVA